MNYEEKKVEPLIVKNDEQSLETPPKSERKVNKQVDFITKRIQFRDVDKTTLCRCITIFNIDYAISENELIDHFKKVDGFEKMVLLTDPLHPEFKNRGIAYITYETVKDADLAIEKLNHTLIGNRRIRIERSYDQETKIKQKLIRKNMLTAKPPARFIFNYEGRQPTEPSYLSHTRSEHHQRRSHNSSHTADNDQYEYDDDFHHHSSHSSNQANPPQFEYQNSQAPILHSHSSSQMDFLSSYPTNVHNGSMSNALDQPTYASKPFAPNNINFVNDEVEDMVNELSILVELYRDALLTESINNMKNKKD